ncbi:MAG: hypothetical protein WC026_17390 [Hyphomicrobium sp.]|uniref:hypothetical protein n=1 Tax=Hyphomicrobium sp. TaxID=82 RepID=UPI00356A6E2C
MSGYIQIAIVVGAVVAGAAFYALMRYLSNQLKESGKSAERAAQAEADLDIAKKQGEVMVRDENREDTAKSLDDGTF